MIDWVILAIQSSQRYTEVHDDKDDDVHLFEVHDDKDDAVHPFEVHYDKDDNVHPFEEVHDDKDDAVHPFVTRRRYSSLDLRYLATPSPVGDHLY